MGEGTAASTGELVPDGIRIRAREIVAALSLPEKAALTVGRDSWTTNANELEGVPSIWLSDGPTGIRKAPDSAGIGIGDSLPATCFPTASAIGSSWNVDLAHEIGVAMGIEAQALGVHVVLGPGVNLKRSPLGGRNFEYLSEDPVLSGKLAAAAIEGIQSQGVGTSIKHFTANEQETGRMYTDSLVDERTLRENSLRPFEIAIAEAQPWTVMCAYNLLNGTFCAENRRLLHGILRDEWGYEGIVISDWGAVNDRPAGIDAGLHLQMPYGTTVESVVAAVESGNLAPERLDEVVTELLQVVLLADSLHKQDVHADFDAHHDLARRAAVESAVLLKNEGGLLPLTVPPGQTVALIGDFAREPRYQGAGSSQVVPTRVDTMLESLPGAFGSDVDVQFAGGYGPEGARDATLLAEARDLAAGSAAAIVVVGLPAHLETEGRDRSHIDLPAAHNELVETIAAVQPNTVVVLVNGSAVAMPWVAKVPAILEAWLGGQAAGSALADLLSGAANPSGKLAETFPVRIEDTSSYLSFPTAGDGTVRFTEGVFSGHRWYDARKIAPLFPFGHGLSYTRFDYDGIAIDASEFPAHDALRIDITVENTGAVAGSEVVQLYVGECSPRLPRPLRELKAFRKVNLQPGQVETVEFILGWRDLAFYDAVASQWVMEPGEYEFGVGASSVDIRVSARERLSSSHTAPQCVSANTPFRAALDHPAMGAMLQPVLDGLRQFAPSDEAADMMMLFMGDMPLRKFTQMGIFSPEQLDGMLAAANAG